MYITNPKDLDIHSKNRPINVDLPVLHIDLSTESFPKSSLNALSFDFDDLLVIFLNKLYILNFY